MSRLILTRNTENNGTLFLPVNTYSSALTRRSPSVSSSSSSSFINPFENSCLLFFFIPSTMFENLYILFRYILVVLLDKSTRELLI
jgi:hypothetical protein